MEEQGIRLDDLKAALLRRGRLIAVVTLACGLLGIFIASVLPNKYQSFATLLVEPQRISKRLVDGGVEEEALMNRLHLMTMQILSRARLSRIIDELGLYPELSEEMTREEVIAHMRSQIRVEPVLSELETDARRRDEQPVNTFRLFFRHERASTASNVANRLANDFIDEHIRDRVKASSDTAEFIEAEQARMAVRLREVDAQIARIKAENSGSLPENRMANENQLQRTVDALRDAQRRYSEAKGDEDFYRQQAVVVRSSEGRRGDVIGRAISPAVRVQELEIRLGELRARGLTDRHPDVVMTLAEIEDLQARIANPEEGGMSASTAEQEAVSLSQRAALRAEAERSEVERLEAQRVEIEARLAASAGVAEQLDVLNREYQALSQSFQDYSNKRVEASVAANMERRQKGEQFRVLEPAFPAPDPYSPNRPLIAILGVFLGIAIGGGLGLLFEASDSSFHNARTLQEGLRIPVLAAIPGILLEADRRAHRRRLLREVFAAAAVTGVVLIVSLGSYVYVNRPGLFAGDAEAPIEQPAAPAEPTSLPPAEAVGGDGPAAPAGG